MNQAAVWGLVVVVVLIIAGLLVWRTTGPNGEETPVPTLETVDLPAAPTAGQFGLPAPTLVASPAGTTAAPTVSPRSESTVSMSETGFSPATLTVKAGTTVTFVNNGQAPHWPASEVHPTHQLLPGFDSLRGLATGETYSFTFTQKGSWRCHDHLNPQLKCTIVVE